MREKGEVDSKKWKLVAVIIEKMKTEEKGYKRNLQSVELRTILKGF